MRTRLTLTLLAALLALPACPKPTPPPAAVDEEPEWEPEPEPEPTPRPEPPPPEPVRCELTTIHFDFDRASVRELDRGAVRDNAGCLEALGHPRVRLEGHADDRGSTDYNLALGQRRAEAVRAFLEDLGVPWSSVEVVSFGEERPATAGVGEHAWATNRRVELRLSGR